MRWTLKRLEISALLVFHLAAVTVWLVPPCALQDRLLGSVAYYLMLTGQCPERGMFAPDPLPGTITLEAVALDARGLVHTFQFPREADRSRFGASCHYRHWQYAASLALRDEFKVHREFAARHAIRQLQLPSEAFPVELDLVSQISPAAPPGTRTDARLPPAPRVVASYRFPSLEEVQP